MQPRAYLLLISSLILLLVLPAELRAQRFGFQMVAHVNRPDFRGSDGLVLWSTRDFTTFGLGWRGEVLLNDDWSIHLGLDYNNFQYMFTTNYIPANSKGPEANYRHYLQMQEFQIPVVIRHTFHYKDSLAFYAIAGVSSRGEPLARMTVRPSDNNTPVYDGNVRMSIHNRKPWGTLLGGIGMEFQRKNKRIRPFIEFTYREVYSLYYYQGTDDGGVADQFLGQRMLSVSFGLAL